MACGIEIGSGWNWVLTQLLVHIPGEFQLP